MRSPRSMNAKSNICAPRGCKMLNHHTVWGDPARFRPIATLPRVPGTQFVGVTRTGRELRCTVCTDGSFFTDSNDVCLIVGWKPLTP